MLDPLARYLDRGLSVSFYSDTYPNNFAEVRISSPPPVVMILSFSEGQKSLCILRAGTVEASVTQLHFDFEQQDAVKGKEGGPSLLRRNRPFLRVLFRRTEIFLTKAAHNEHVIVSMHLCYNMLPNQSYWPKNNGQYFQYTVI